MTFDYFMEYDMNDTWRDYCFCSAKDCARTDCARHESHIKIGDVFSIAMLYKNCESYEKEG